jgi:dihydrodipicolinate synthase/N-acetylneuraminate lyase
MAGLGTGSGGGGGANAIRAGNAYVEMGVKDKTGPDLAKIQTNLAEFGKRAAKVVGGKSGELFEKAGQGGIGALGAVAVAGAMKEIAKHSAELFPSLRAASRELERIEGTAKSSAFSLGRINEDFERARGLATTPQAGADLLSEQIKSQKRALENQDRLMKQASDISMKVGNRGFGEIFLRDQILGGSTRDDLKDAEATIDKLGDARVAMDKKLQELKQQRIELDDPFKNAGFNESFKNLGRDIDDATDPAIEAMGALERKVFDATRALRAMAGPEALARFDALAARARDIDDALKFKEWAKPIDKFKEDMAEAVAMGDPAWMKEVGEKRGEFEKRLIDGAKDLKVGADEFAKLLARAKEVDAKLKGFGLDRDFNAGVQAARFKRTTQGLSPEDAELAGLIDKGWADARILELRRMQGIKGPGLDLDRLKEIRADLNPQFVSGLKEQLALAAGEAARTAGSAGTFSAMQAGQLGRIDAIPKQQLEELKDANETLVKLETIFTQVRMGLALR